MPGAEKNRYSKIIESYTQHELEIISQYKRFTEMCVFDKEFTSLLEEHPEHPYVHERLKRAGVKLSVNDILPNILKTESSKFIEICNSPKTELSDYPNLEKELARFPLVLLWIKWKKDTNAHARNYYGVHGFVNKNPSFNSWRMRRIAAAKSELGHYGNIIDHPIFAYELNRGCSVGCRFCAFAAEKLSATFAYTQENRAFWREILQAGVDLFGRAAGWALCYYRTEPFDNSHYLEFIQDFEDITKTTACTSTAAPLKNIDKFRSLIQYYRKKNLCWPQISVLSAGMAKKLHEIYTPNELRDADLVNQTQNTDYRKAISGKTMHWDRKKPAEPNKKTDDVEFIPQASISCVTGFLINMIDHSIQLISPCKATEKHPFGYRIYAEAEFTDAMDYRMQIECIIKDKMKDNVESNTKLAFRDDLAHEPAANGFILKSLYQTHIISGDSSLKLLGALIAEGRYTYGEIAKILREKGTNTLVIPGMIKNLYDQGFIDETLI